MKLPTPFVETIQKTFGDRGRTFLDSLPDLMQEAADCWQLTDLRPAANLSYNFIAFAHRLDQEVVLKLGVPDRELTSEIASLRLFGGRGVVRLLESNADHGMLLLERLCPGDMLVALTDDAQATHIAADVMLALRRPAPSDRALIQLRDWFKGFESLRLRFHGGTGPFDSALMERAEAAVREFFAEDYEPFLIHGDLHHFNILSSERGWLAIDPKGVIGPPAYEVGPLLINPWTVSGVQLDTRRLMQTRIAILSERLGLGRQRIRQWGLAHAVLSAWWSLDEGQEWRPAMECVRLLAS